MTARRRITVLTQFYPPEVGAPQTRLPETLRGLQHLGWEVAVVTCPPHYPSGRIADGFRRWLPSREVRDGISVVRLPMIARPNRGFLDRIVDQGSFAVTALAALPVVRSSDVLLVESPPLFLGLTARMLRLLARRPYVFHVADPWPDFPIAMGALPSRPLQQLAFWLERTAYEGATAVTTVTPPLVQRLSVKPGASGKVHLLRNGVDVARMDPTVDPARARASLGWPEARLTLVYLGTVGLAQGVGTLIDAVGTLHDAGVVLHIVGAGAEVAQIAADVEARGIRNIHLHPAVSSSDVPSRLAAADAIAVLLRSGPLYDESLPTKLVEGLAAGRPLVVSAGGEAARIVHEAGAGVVAPPGDAEALAAAILHLATSADIAAMGEAARRVALRDFDRQLIVAELSRLLEEAVLSVPRPR